MKRRMGDVSAHVDVFKTFLMKVTGAAWFGNKGRSMPPSEKAKNLLEDDLYKDEKEGDYERKKTIKNDTSHTCRQN